MKINQLIFLFIVLSNLLVGQVTISEPVYATQNDSIIIYFDATEGNQGLMGYTGEVYAHTGVITNESTGPSDWKYVVADWGVNIPKNHLSRISTNYYKLAIGYPREYYGLTDPEEVILQLAFVFRNPTGTITGRDVSGADIFHDLYEPGLSTIIISPDIDLSFGDPRRSPIFAVDGETIHISATAATIGTQIDSLKILNNGEILAGVEGDTINFDFIPDGLASGYQIIEVISRDTFNIKDTVSFSIMINPEIVEENVPAGVSTGINYIDNNTVTLCLLAPYKEFVYVIGDFNDWFVDETYLMKRDSMLADSVCYWITLNDLIPGEEYAFQYLVDGEIRLADVFTHKILDPWNDQYITDAVYPDLKAYPEGKTREPVSVLQTGREEYQWQHSDTYVRPDKEKLVVYELLLRDFLEAHTYAALIDTLDYLDRLGITAVELMPVNEFEGNNSWGYNPSFYFAPDKYYGPENDLKRFIDECHGRGIAVILDMVLNHSFGQSPMVRLYWDEANDRPAANSLWFNQTATHPYNVGYDFNHLSRHTETFVDTVNAFWIKEYHIDGYRFDLSKGFMQSGSFYDYNQQRINILKRMVDRIREVDDSSYVIFEHLGANDEETVLANYGIMLWGKMTDPYNEATMGYHDNSDFSWGYYINRGWQQPNLVTYMESHDEERLMAKNLAYGESSGDYDVQDLNTSLQRMKMAGAFFFTYPGPKMIWQFGEVGYDFWINYPGVIGGDDHRLTPKPIRWDYLLETERNKLYRTWAALLKIRNENEVFTSAETSVSMSLNESNGKKWIFLSHSSMNVSIVGNFGVTTQELDAGFPYTANWFEYFSGDTLNGGSAAMVNLQPGEFRIYTTVKLEMPDSGLVTGIGDKNVELPSSYFLNQNYPNPFNPETRIGFNLPKASKIKLTVFNALGQRVMVLADRQFNAGYHTVNWNGIDANGLNAASGVYIIHIDAGEFVQSRKMVLVR